jgi:hypothetical protein
MIDNGIVYPAMVQKTKDVGATALFVDFVYLLRDYGVPASPRDLIELNRGLEKGIVKDLDDLFVFTRLTFVRRKEHMDAFERAFALYFFGVDIPSVAEGDPDLLRTKAFREWLSKQIEEGLLPERAMYSMTAEELMKKFWETVREQMEAHEGGSRWVGQRGNSPFGHSGNAERGVRVHGQSQHRSAIKVIAGRRYIAYADTNVLKNENLRQALESMKHMKDVGPHSLLNLDETIRRTARDGGEIDLVFERERRDRISVMLMIDNGGYSMDPYIDLTQMLFARLHDRFEDITTYYFHNTIYQHVWPDFRRSKKIPMDQLLLRNPDTRLVIIGDATMAPEELESPFGAIYYYAQDQRPSVYWLRRLGERFKHTVWLNPIPRNYWSVAHGMHTLVRIREIFHMEDMTLGGIKGMVEFLSESGK